MSELKKIPVILDGDPGHDDAIGWTLAQGSGRFDILAVTSCSGNVGIEKTTYNTLRVCTLLGIDAPIAEGCPHPLTADVMNAPSVHGESGIGRSGTSRTCDGGLQPHGGRAHGEGAA